MLMVTQQMVRELMNIGRPSTRVPLTGDLALRLDMTLSNMFNFLARGMYNSWTVFTIAHPFTLVRKRRFKLSVSWLWRAKTALIEAGLCQTGFT